MYESPIQLNYLDNMINEIARKKTEDTENYIYECIQNIGVAVDKDELVRALQYDRDQYNKGYNDAKKEIERMLYDMSNEIVDKVANVIQDKINMLGENDV